MLHKSSKMTGFHVIATDGETGHVDDFLVDEGWTVRYLVVDTSNWIGGKAVLVSSAAIDKINSPEKEIRVKLTSEQIKNSPPLETADVELTETLPPVII